MINQSNQATELTVIDGRVDLEEKQLKKPSYSGYMPMLTVLARWLDGVPQLWRVLLIFGIAALMTQTGLEIRLYFGTSSLSTDSKPALSEYEHPHL